MTEVAGPAEPGGGGGGARGAAALPLHFFGRLFLFLKMYKLSMQYNYAHTSMQATNLLLLLCSVSTSSYSD